MLKRDAEGLNMTADPIQPPGKSPPPPHFCSNVEKCARERKPHSCTRQLQLTNASSQQAQLRNTIASQDKRNLTVQVLLYSFRNMKKMLGWRQKGFFPSLFRDKVSYIIPIETINLVKRTVFSKFLPANIYLIGRIMQVGKK